MTTTALPRPLPVHTTSNRRNAGGEQLRSKGAAIAVHVECEVSGSPSDVWYVVVFPSGISEIVHQTRVVFLNGGPVLEAFAEIELTEDRK